MRLQHQFNFAAVTGHPEKAGAEQGDVGVSITLQADIHLGDLATVIADEHASALIDHLYDQDGRFQTNNIEGAIALTVVHESVTAKMRASNEEHSFKDCELDGIKLTPKLSRVIEFKARLKLHPATNTERGWLHAHHQREVSVLLDGKRFKIAATVKDERQPELGLPAQGEQPAKDPKEPKAPKAAKKRAAETA